MKPKSALLVSTSVLFLLSGCGGGSTPSNSDIQKAHQISGCTEEVLVVRNVQKTNGVPQGQEYQVFYDFELLFPLGMQDAAVVKKNERCYETLAMSGIVDVRDPSTIPQPGGVKVYKNGVMTMVKSEKGWIRNF